MHYIHRMPANISLKTQTTSDKVNSNPTYSRRWTVNSTGKSSIACCKCKENKLIRPEPCIAGQWTRLPHETKGSYICALRLGWSLRSLAAQERYFALVKQSSYAGISSVVFAVQRVYRQATTPDLLTIWKCFHSFVGMFGTPESKTRK